MDRLEALGELLAQGLELTPGDVELFILCDAQMWRWINRRIVIRMH